jgi:hypothetical protein
MVSVFSRDNLCLKVGEAKANLTLNNKFASFNTSRLVSGCFLMGKTMFRFCQIGVVVPGVSRTQGHQKKSVQNLTQSLTEKQLASRDHLPKKCLADPGELSQKSTVFARK